MSISRGVVYFYIFLGVGMALTASLALVEGPLRIFGVLLTLTLLLIWAAFAARHKRWLRTLPALLAFLAASLVADEWCYLTWTSESLRVLSALTQSMKVGNPEFVVGRMAVTPNAYIVRPQQQLLFHFEPPFIVWTYHLSKLNAARPCVDAIFGALRAVFWSPAASWEAKELVSTHTPWDIGVMRCHVIAACRSGDPNEWVIYADHGHGI